MRTFNNMRKAQPVGEYQKLPVGGYVCRINNAVVIDNNDKEILQIKYDIYEGEYKDFFSNQFINSNFANKKYKGIYNIILPKIDDEEDIKMRRLNSFIKSVEESNTGYKFNFDENTLNKKLFGGVFGEKEYDFNGNKGICTVLRLIIPVEDIRQNNYKIPSLWKLKNTEQSEILRTALQEVDNEELPF